MQSCEFCLTEGRELYCCPKCNVNYCSIRCYRNEKHNNCTEVFYKECVKQQLEGKRFEGNPTDTFEERMQKYVRGEIDELPGTGKPEEEGEPIDSDDEDPNAPEDNYLTNVLQDTIDGYTLADDELDRRLLAMGLGADVEQLMSSLTDEEKAAFAQLSEQIYQKEEGLGTSCFSRN
ncbi:unnamed protein product [Auanema sp. JU1783]|nr:unnamed protein product [Auanema sp. JU1783]